MIMLNLAYTRGNFSRFDLSLLDTQLPRGKSHLDVAVGMRQLDTRFDRSMHSFMMRRTERYHILILLFTKASVRVMMKLIVVLPAHITSMRCSWVRPICRREVL